MIWNTSGLPQTVVKPGSNYVALFNTETESVTRLRLEGFDPHNLQGMHGLDAFVDRKVDGSPKVTLFLVNHRLPADLDQVHETGADSTIEVFETRLGSNYATHLRTLRDEDFIVTPNALVATSPTTFYLTNGALSHSSECGLVDQMYRRSSSENWSGEQILLISFNFAVFKQARRMEWLIHPAESGVAYCDLDQPNKLCSLAVADIALPNGIAKVNFFSLTTARR